MKIDFDGNQIPYPLAVLRGRLHLAGVSRPMTESIFQDLNERQFDSSRLPIEEELISHIRDKIPKELVANFDILTEYDRLRRTSLDTPPVVIVLEGASASGKSMLALDVISLLSATRIISTDTIRQILRGLHSEEEHPELFCHTYQAYKCRQSGPRELDPILRGFHAQCELMESAIRSTIQRVLDEGTEAIVEGVHILPGSLQILGPSVIEILINPDSASHHAMFLAKHSTSGLKTVSADAIIRDTEYRAARMIQEYMVELAKSSNIKVISLTDFKEAGALIRTIIFDAIKELVKSGSGDKK